jgi:flagellar hook assembly protein FlgD
MGIYSLDGRLVRDLGGALTDNQAVWDGRDLAGAAVKPGLYILKVRNGQEVAQSRIVVTAH